MSCMDEFHYQIYSEYDGWYIQKIKLDTNECVGEWSWGHENEEAGVGGEKLFANILRDLGVSVYQEDVC